MTPRPAVSVLMPVLNPHPAYFPEAVASVLAQTLADWELVIVEDPSAVSAGDLLKRFDDPRIRHITNPARTGLLAQRNRTLHEAQADLVAMLDADDVMMPGRLEAQVAFLANHPDIAVVGSHLRVIDPAGAEVGFRQYPTTPEAILRTMPRFNAVPQPAVTGRKAVFQALGGYQLDGPAEDYELWSRMMLAGHRFAHLEEPLTRYRIHPHASKGKQLRLTIRNTLQVKRQHWWGRMTWKDRLRYRAEQALLGVPPGLVYRLFSTVTYRRPAPAG